jgi:peroxiredoxin
VIDEEGKILDAQVKVGPKESVKRTLETLREA